MTEWDGLLMLDGDMMVVRIVTANCGKHNMLEQPVPSASIY
jgi:hypothetical protein